MFVFLLFSTFYAITVDLILRPMCQFVSDIQLHLLVSILVVIIENFHHSKKRTLPSAVPELDFVLT